ncbi:serine-enriched protein [Trichonephila inaurata madagascariensis]|uniref:Serine-enriched protein n=2 Tax=Trichonephila TaxID=2585208 RepID=A0A8X6YSA8_9ARAC|nr:serine-enriched protein [Trichonephila inaurata madagascariensis]
MSEELAEAEETEDYSVFENKTGLAEDMKFLASMPELCDVTFLVGDTREPVCAVKAVLAARSSQWGVGKFSHVEFSDQNRILRVCLLFPNGVGVKARGKVSGYANAKGIG